MNWIFLCLLLIFQPAFALDGDGQQVLKHYTDTVKHKPSSQILAYKAALLEAYRLEKKIHDSLTELRCKMSAEDLRYMCNTRLNNGEGVTLFEIEDELWWERSQYLHDLRTLNTNWNL